MLGNEQNNNQTEGPSSPIDEDLVREIEGLFDSNHGLKDSPQSSTTEEPSSPIDEDLAQEIEELIDSNSYCQFAKDAVGWLHNNKNKSRSDKTYSWLEKEPVINEPLYQQILEAMHDYIITTLPEIEEVTADDFAGKDNLETVCEYLIERANRKYKIELTYLDEAIRGLYKYIKNNNGEKTQNPLDGISLRKLYKEINAKVQYAIGKGKTPDKNKIITEVLTDINNGKINVRKEKKVTDINNGENNVRKEKKVTDINNGEIDVSKLVKFDIAYFFVSRYQNERYQVDQKGRINRYLRAIFPKVTNATQGTITADSLVGKDNIETLCEFVFKDINLGKKYYPIKESSISSFYNYLNSKNKNIRNPIEYISLEKLYKEVRKIVQNNNNLDKDEVIKQVMKGIYGGKLDVCRYGKTAIYERNLYKRFVITDKFVSSRNGDVSKEERNEFEEWLKPKELDLSKTDSYIDKYNEEKQLNNNAMQTNESGQSSTSSRKRQYSPRPEDRNKKQCKGNEKGSTPEELQRLQIQLSQNTGIPNTLNQGTHGIVDSTKVLEGTQIPQNSQENNLALQEITLEVPFLANNNLIQITAYKIPNTDVMFDCNNVQLIKDENGIIRDVKNYQLFLNNDGYLVTGNGYYPIPITHPVAAIIGKHGYTLGPLGDIKLPLCFAPNENAFHFLKGTYKQTILLDVDRNGIYDSLGNKIIVEKGQDGKIRITYPKEKEANEKIKSMIEQPTYGMNPYYQSLNGQGINPSAPIQTQQNNTNPSMPYFVQHNNG